MDKIAALKKTEMFGTLAPTELAVISSACVEKKVRKGEILFSAGDEPKGLYVIAKGSLSAYRENHEGREQIIHLEEAGTTMAEVPVFDDKPYPSSVRAEEDSELLFLSGENVKKLFTKHPSIALSALRLMASRLRKTAALLESISLREVDQRLASFLLHEFQEKKSKKLKLPSLSILASRLGSVREVVSRALAKLEKDGFIAVDRQRFATLLDEKGLRGFIGR